MSEPLSDHERETTLRVARVMYPHDALPDEAYENVVRTHNIGTARMSERPEDGVGNRFGQARDAPNRFVSDASQFTTGAAANPTLTIVALAIRQTEYITGQLRSGASPTGHAVWDDRDPGGPAPDCGAAARSASADQPA
jgi:choline dehydrogenase-like flavoprotein